MTDSLFNDIQGIIANIYPDAYFSFSKRFEANLDSFSIDTADLPLIILDNGQTIEGTNFKNANLREETPVSIYFLNKDDLTNNDAETEEVRAGMHAYARRIYGQILRLTNVQLDQDANLPYKIDNLYHVYNTNLTGVSLTINVPYQIIVNFDPNPNI